MTPSQGPAEWVCGETASVDIHIQNPTSVTLRVRLTALCSSTCTVCMRIGPRVRQQSTHRSVTSRQTICLPASMDASSLAARLLLHVSSFSLSTEGLCTQAQSCMGAVTTHRQTICECKSMHLQLLLDRSVLFKSGPPVVLSDLLQIERMTLEAEHAQDPSIAPIDHQPTSQAPPVWRGHPVQMQLPPQTGPVKVCTGSLLLLAKPCHIRSAVE